MKQIQKLLLPLFIAFSLMLFGCTFTTSSNPSADHDNSQAAQSQMKEPESGASFTLDTIPAYAGSPYVIINDNMPVFAASDYTETSFERYHDLDELGRCGAAFANVGVDTMPTKERGSIGQVKPTGWQTVKYDNVDGKYLYNRCHLIGYQLTAENANDKNLITGTRYLNVDGMLPFENMIADYVKETKHHVLYRVTPIFEGENLVAAGVQMEAASVEDDMEGICFNVFCYNVQPGIVIDYTTGESKLEEEEQKPEIPAMENQEATYILNTSSHKFHDPSCASAGKIAEQNKDTYIGSREGLIEDGYAPCGSCKP